MDKEVESVMAVATPLSEGMRSRKRKRETEEASLSADAVSEKNLKETAPMILARGKTADYKSSSAPRKLFEVLREIEVSKTPGTEEDFKTGLSLARRKDATYFLRVDHVSDNRHHCSNMPSKSDGK